MNGTLRTAAAIVCACGFMIGCDTRPRPVRLSFWRSLKVLGVAPGDRTELTAATASEKARINYLHRLKVLQAYYDRVGNMDKHVWAANEIENLQEAHWFRWEGIPNIEPPKGENIADADERLLAEYLAQTRKAYDRAMTELLGLYERRGEAFKASVIRRVRERLDPVRRYTYIFPAEIPGSDLKPSEVIPAAQTLFEKALSLHLGGKPLPGVTFYPKQREALMMFYDVVRKYPTSTRIPLAAYYIADIYKEYFNENIRAVRWYERAWQWDPTITKPARFQAAAVYDLRLHNKEKAVEIYRQVLKHETFNESNVQFARERLRELLKAPAKTK